MGHAIQKNDTVMVTGTQAWHRLGVVVEDAPTVAGAMQIAGLDWEVDACPMSCTQERHGETRRITCPNIFANVRSDTYEPLGYVSERYTIVQNSDLADLVQQASDAGAIPRVETAGSLRNGRLVFLCSRMDTMMVGGKDPVNPYFTLLNGHDGKHGLEAMAVTIRTVCANTARMSQMQAKGTGNWLNLRHSGNIKERINEVRALFFTAQEQANSFQEAADAMYQRKLNTGEVRKFFLDVYQTGIGEIPANPQDAREDRKRDKALKTVAHWLQNFESPTCTENGVSGSAWGAYNAVTEWSDHQRTVRRNSKSEDKQDARNFSNLFGRSNQFKGRAAEAALALA